MLHSIPFYIGVRYLRAKRRNHFISFISMVSMIGLMLGVAVLIIVLSVMNGFDREMRERVLGMIPHASIMLPGQMDDSEWVRQQALKHPMVVGASAYIESQGMVISESSTRGAAFMGVDPVSISSVSIIPQHLEEGSFDRLSVQPYGVIIGETMARLLRVSMGDKITVIVPKASVSVVNVQPRFKRFEVVGIFKVGTEMDSSLMLMNIDDLGTLLQYDGLVDGVQLKTTDLFKARQIALEIGRTLTKKYYVSDWTRTQGNLFQAIQMEKKLVGLLLFMIVAVAVFNIVSSLIMLVTDKQGEIAVLRTLGARSRQIMGIFMVQGSLIGIIGIVSGVFFGVIGALTIADILSGIESLFNTKFMNPEVYFIDYIPSQLKWSDVLIVSLASLVISVIATLYPAWKASRITPAEVLRYER